MHIARWMGDAAFVWRGLAYCAWLCELEEGELKYPIKTHDRVNYDSTNDAGFDEYDSSEEFEWVSKTTALLVDEMQMQTWPEVYIG